MARGLLLDVRDEGFEHASSKACRRESVLYGFPRGAHRVIKERCITEESLALFENALETATLPEVAFEPRGQSVGVHVEMQRTPKRVMVENAQGIPCFARRRPDDTAGRERRVYALVKATSAEIGHLALD